MSETRESFSRSGRSVCFPAWGQRPRHRAFPQRPSETQVKAPPAGICWHEIPLPNFHRMSPLIRWGLLVDEVDCQRFFFGVDSSEAESNRLNRWTDSVQSSTQLSQSLVVNNSRYSQIQFDRSNPVPADLANGRLSCDRRARENDNLVVSCDKALHEQLTDEAVAASKDDATCHTTISPKSDFASASIDIGTCERSNWMI